MEDNTISTQEFIEDARARKKALNNKENSKFKCDKCDYKSGSKTLMYRHINNIHKEIQNPENKKESAPVLPSTGKKNTREEATKPTEIPIVLEERQNSPENTPKNHPQKKYIHKRLKCEQCDKKFNKKETFKKHMETIHKDRVHVDISQKAVSSTKKIPPIVNMTSQKMKTRQMAIKTRNSSGDHNN